MLSRSVRAVTAVTAVTVLVALAACSSSTSKATPNSGATTHSSTATAPSSAASARAVANYLDYVKHQANTLAQTVAPFAAAVKRGDIATAKTLFASTRYHYEAIEPVAESFGNLDPDIDVREHDTSSPSQFIGFHRIEKALWSDNTVAGMGPIADELVINIAQLHAKIATLKLVPEQIAQGAMELLNEVSTSKITGEEDTYSHTDLSDFAANVEGSKAAFQSIEPLLAASDSGLTAMITARFDAVEQVLDKYRSSSDPIGNGYALYNTLTPADTRELSQVLDTLAQPMSKIAAQLF
ncbi:MAG TPA: iron uptake system protein EfeO [Acidimicrobiia bacterium]